MKNLLWPGRFFYGIGVAGIGLQQFIYSEFRPVLLPYWPASVPGQNIFAYISGALLILAGLAIILDKKGRMACYILAGFFFLLFLSGHVYFQLFLNPNDFHLASWTDALKELAFSGGALLVAASFPEQRASAPGKFLQPLGTAFFSIMLIAFGIDHFLYTEFVATLVPNWIPGHIFWTYFAAVALIGSGVCFLLQFQAKLVGILCGVMLFVWFILLHIPRAIADPQAAKGNEITSVFQALAFSGIAFIIAWLNTGKTGYKRK